MANDFFETYPEFFDTSQTGTKDKLGNISARLPNRYVAMMLNNVDAIRDARVLDLASHDGRWSMAALHLGARHVLGIEGRQELVERAEATFLHHRIPRSSYDFKVGDIMEHLPGLEIGRFDTIFCLGIFYHTLHHWRYFEEFDRLGARHIILDTKVVIGKGPIIRFNLEDHNRESATIQTHQGRQSSVVGVPNTEMIQFLCEHFGFAQREIVWSDDWVKDWNGCPDYRNGRRKTYLLTRK